MNSKENILESWIMVEHLSEGDIKLSDKDLKTIESPAEDDYYTFFLNEIVKKKLKKYQKGGIAIRRNEGIRRAADYVIEHSTIEEK